MMTSVCVALSLAGGACPGPDRELPGSVRGVVLGLHDADARRSYRRDVEAVHRVGANAVSLMPTWSMQSIRDATVGRGNSTRAQLEEALSAAHANGLSVLVAPVIQIEQLDDDEWRGVLAPPDWDVWFASYRQLMTETATVAEAYGADALLIGSELCSSETFASRWQTVIAEVRAVFEGSLGYQANWDHRDVPMFLHDLDFLASNAYFELVEEGQRPTIDQLVLAWKPFHDDLVGWARRRDKPLIITEVGYPSIAGGTAYPWDYTRETTIDLEEQRRGFEAMLRVWLGGAEAAGEPARGLFVYEWWGEGGANDRGYTPRGKPAEATLRRWFAESP